MIGYSTICKSFYGTNTPTLSPFQSQHIPLTTHKQTFPYIVYIMLHTIYIYYVLVLLSIEDQGKEKYMSYSIYYV